MPPCRYDDTLDVDASTLAPLRSYSASGGGTFDVRIAGRGADTARCKTPVHAEARQPIGGSTRLGNHRSYSPTPGVDRPRNTSRAAALGLAPLASPTVPPATRVIADAPRGA